jgi:FtsH-binding integral membrane protein
MSRYPGPFNQMGAAPLDYESRLSAGTLATFFNAVYAWMATGLALTAVVAWVVSQNLEWVRQIFHPGVILILFLAELGLVVAISGAINRISASTATGLFLLYSALNGLTLSIIFLAYTHASIASTFFVTAGAFGATSVYGFVTKRDLTSLGSLLFMALIGLILASVVNIFFMNPALYWAISYAGVIIFVGLTAYDTQKLKNIAAQTEGNPELSNRMAIAGSLSLYLDFINLFLFLLRILGKRR